MNTWVFSFSTANIILFVLFTNFIKLLVDYFLLQKNPRPGKSAAQKQKHDFFAFLSKFH